MESAILGGKLPRFNLDDLAFRIGRDNFLVRAEQLRTRMEAYPVLILSQVLLQPLFVWLFWDKAPHAGLLLWLAASFALHAVEFFNLVMHVDKLKDEKQCRDWHVHFTFFALASGSLWGAAAMLFFPTDVFYQGIMICVMLGLVAGAVTLNPVHPPSSLAYLSGIMLPLIARVAAEGDLMHAILAVMLVLFMLVVVAAGQVLSRTFMLAMQQRFENMDLLQQLTAQDVEMRQARKELEIANFELMQHEANLERMVQERTARLEQQKLETELIKDATILALSSLAETRDNETGNHIRRTQRYVQALAVRLRNHPRFRHFLNEDNITLLYKVAPLHDVGKVGIPDAILHKPSKLTPEEFEVMKNHAELGGKAIAQAMNGMDVQSPFLDVASQIAMSHHERWDGSGYPAGLSGEEIPIAARLMALADVYDALSCRRVYKSAMEADEVERIILEGRGNHFDPDVVDAFISIRRQFSVIANNFKD